MARMMKIETVCEERYGVNALTCDAIVIEWSADFLAEQVGLVQAMAEWKRINRKRERRGVYTTIPRYFGSPQWKAYFGE